MYLISFQITTRDETSFFFKVVGTYIVLNTQRCLISSFFYFTDLEDVTERV